MTSASQGSDDSRLLLAVAGGDEAAFSELYDRLSAPVFAMIVRILRSRAEAEEVMQEAFWQVWERASSYRPELGSAFCWVVTLARRKAIDRLRANSRHLRRISEAQAAREDDDFMLPAALETLSVGERVEAIKRALQYLNIEERRAIALAFFEGLTHEEVATAVKAPVGTVKARIRRGLLKLKPKLALLRPSGPTPSDP